VADDQAVFGALLRLKIALTGASDETTATLAQMLVDLGLDVILVPVSAAPETDPALAVNVDCVFGPGGDPVPVDGTPAGWLDRLSIACGERVRNRRGEERHIGQLDSEIAGLEIERDAAHIEARRFNRLSAHLFAEPVLTAPPKPLAWLIRAGHLARDVLGERPLDTIPSRLQTYVKTLLGKPILNPGFQKPPAFGESLPYGKVGAKLWWGNGGKTLHELETILERQASLGNWTVRARRVLTQGGVRATLLRHAVKLLSR
jgi:hypothetical protein